MGAVSNALFSQVDLYASLASLTGQDLSGDNAPDSFNNLGTLLGAAANREYVVQQSLNNTLSLIQGNWKYIEPSNGPKMNVMTNTELGNLAKPQLYDLKADVGERNNLAGKYPSEVKRMSNMLKKVKESHKTR